MDRLPFNRLSVGKFKVLAFVAENVWAFSSYIGESMGMSEATASKYLNRLSYYSLIEREGLSAKREGGRPRLVGRIKVKGLDRLAYKWDADEKTVIREFESWVKSIRKELEEAQIDVDDYLATWQSRVFAK